MWRAPPADEALYTKLLLAVRIWTPDGGSDYQAAGRLLRDSDMPHIVLVLRDRMHAFKGSLERAVRSDEHYNGLLDRAFEGEKSVSKRIQHSTVLNTKFLAAQATVNREKGSQGGGVVSCVRDMSHAKQRATAITSGCRREIVHLEAMIVESHTPSWGAQRAEGPSSSPIGADDFSHTAQPRPCPPAPSVRPNVIF